MTKTDQRPDHGYVLTAAHADYSDLERPGSVTIKQGDQRVEVRVANFRWGEKGSCREQVTKAMCWARDVLEAAIRADMLVPGGHLVAIEDSDLSEVICTKCDWEGARAELLNGEACPKCKTVL